MKSTIVYDDFAKLDLRVGTVTNCEKKEGSEKLLRLTVDFGEEGQRNILSGIAKWYTPDDLINKQFIFVINLTPRKMMGEESQGMILAAGNNFEDKPELLTTLNNITPGFPIM